MRYKIIYTILISLFVFSEIQATHIVGGELTYKCLGNNEYEIKLTVFRDCYNGNPLAWFDNPASIGVFNSSNQLVTALSLPLTSINDTLQPVLDDPCFIVPPDVCVHTTTYTDTLNLPFSAGGYHLAYQRCCRNGTIVNIVAPLATGATFYSFISEKALSECNTAAVFNDWPPLYICVNEPISFDHSAFDVDGDSLVYELCAPFEGASQLSPIPQPPNAPPYSEVTWVSPTYSLDNLLGGIPLEIDSVTGMLSGTPNTVGQFVVGVCVREYRNDTLISLTKRDFQYNVGICGKVTAAIGNSNIWCEGLTVQFDNDSENTKDFIWDFGIDSISTDTSTLFEPAYTFPDSGQYLVTLVAIGDDSTCNDTTYLNLHVLPKYVHAEFEYAIESCLEDSLEISIENISYDSIHGIASYAWYANGSPMLLSSETEPTLSIPFDINNQIQITLVANSNNGCADTFSLSYSFEIFDYVINQDYNICTGFPITLNSNPVFGNYNFSWSPEELFEDPNEVTPTIYPEENVVVFLNLTDTITGCSEQYPINIQIQPSVEYYLPIDTAQCDTLPIQLKIEHNYDELITAWAFNSLTDGYVAFDTDSVLVPYGVEQVIAIMGAGEACTYHYVNIQRDSLRIETQDFVLCPNESIVLNVGGEDYYTYEWSPGTGLNDTTIPNPICTINESIVYTLNVSFPEGGCFSSYPIEVAYQSPELLADLLDTATCEQSLSYDFSATPFTIDWTIVGNNDLQYSSNIVEVNTNNGYQQIAYLHIVDQNNCAYQDTVTFEFYSIEMDSVLKILNCKTEDSSLIILPQNNPSDWPLDYDFNFENDYYFNGFDSLWLYPPFPTTGTWSITEMILGCSDTANISIQYSDELIDYELNAQADPAVLLSGMETQLSADFYEELSYQWSPSDLTATANEATTLASPLSDTTFYIVAFDGNGCTYEDSVQLTLLRGGCDIPHVFIPNAFSPNDDGDNDMLYVRGVIIASMDFKVFNEWGELIFQTQDTSEGWDGTFEGKAAPVGVYAYVLDLVCANGEELHQQGNITLIR